MGGGVPPRTTQNWCGVARTLGLPPDTPRHIILETIGNSKDSICRQKLVKQTGLNEEAKAPEIAEALSRRSAHPAPGLGDRR